MSAVRTIYLSKLRRAFLLRVHPDRFRNQSIALQTQQATLVKALSDRMNQSDFTNWLSQHELSSNFSDIYKVVGNRKQNQQLDTYRYVIEKRDGSMLQTTLSLNRSVEDILLSMSNALKKSGAGASIPVSPITRKSSQSSRYDDKTAQTNSSNITAQSWGNGDDLTAAALASMTSSTENKEGNSTIDTRYDVRSNQGRDLKLFLQQQYSGISLLDQIRDLRLARMDAISIALQIRRVYQFSAVDATETGWSSTSAATLFRRLLSVHEEFAHLFHVSSFYPIRVIFSPYDDPDNQQSALDIYGGILRLNPASTSLQWVETLQYVSQKTIEQVVANRECALQRTKTIQRYLSIKLSKGFTCSSHDYHSFLERLAEDIEKEEMAENELLQISNASLTVEPIHVVVESDSICRRAIVTSAGMIRLGVGMSKEDCIYSIHRLSMSAREQILKEKVHIQQCLDIVSNVKFQLPGLQKVFRKSNGVVTHSEFIDSVTRFIHILSQQFNSSKGQQHLCLFQPLIGNSLGIAPTGHSCQLGDDGSVIIPHNWTYV